MSNDFLNEMGDGMNDTVDDIADIIGRFGRYVKVIDKQGYAKQDQDVMNLYVSFKNILVSADKIEKELVKTVKPWSRLDDKM